MRDSFEAGDSLVLRTEFDRFFEKGLRQLRNQVGFWGTIAAVDTGIALGEGFQVLCVGQLFSFGALDARRVNNGLISLLKGIMRTFELYN